MNKKLILSVVISSLFSVSAFAGIGGGNGPDKPAVDTTSATIEWAADIPVVVPGQWVTFTGPNGAVLPNQGMLDIKADGTFSSTPVNLEIHYYDDETQSLGDGVVLGGIETGINAESISYTVEQAQFSSKKGVDMSGVESTVVMDGVNTIPNQANTVTSPDGWKSEWTIKNNMNSVLPTVVSGDTITATTVVRADVNFTETPEIPEA